LRRQAPNTIRNSEQNTIVLADVGSDRKKDFTFPNKVFIVATSYLVSTNMYAGLGVDAEDAVPPPMVKFPAVVAALTLYVCEPAVAVAAGTRIVKNIGTL
jgi:hypothetical protein